MAYRETLILDGVLQVNHEQRAALSHDVVDIFGIFELAFELGRCQSVHRVDDDLQRIRQLGRLSFVSEIWRQLTSQHLARLVVVLVLDGDPRIQDILKVLRVLVSKQVQVYEAVRVHRLDV